MRKVTFIAIIAIISLWLGGLISFYQKIPAAQNQISKEYDAVIVLTGGKGRISEGMELLRDKKAYRMLISGVHEDTKIEQIADDIDFASVTLGTKAYSTKGNAMESRKWIQKNEIGSIILVTANYHMPRSLSIFKREMPMLEIKPQPVFPEKFSRENWYKSWNSMRLIFTEYTKYLLTF